MNESPEGGAINPAELPYSREALAGREAVLRRAFENHVFELIKGLTAEAERLRQKYPGVNEWPRVIREVKLEGEYPDTVIRLRTYLKSLDREDWVTERLWDPRDADEEARRRSAERIAGDILLNASGG